MFPIGFAVEVDPEFAPDGADPPVRFPSDLPRVGAVLRTSVPGAVPWDIAVGAPNWWRTPSPTAIALISDWRGYLIDVAEHRVLHEEPGTARMWQAQHADLLLMVPLTHLVALGVEGVAWRSDRLAWDDLKVIASSRDGIVCRALVTRDDLARGIGSEIVIDPLTGVQTAGAVFDG